MASLLSLWTLSTWEAAEILRQTCCFAAEDVDGSVLFNFEPNLGSKQLGNGLTVLSTGQQKITDLKLSKLAEGSGSSPLTFRLWHSTAAPSTATASVSDSPPDQGFHDPETETPHAAQTAQPSDNHTSTIEQQPPTDHTSNGSTSNTLSLLLGTSPSAVNYEQGDIPEYSFAATQGSGLGPPSSRQQPSLLQKPVRPPHTSEAPPPPASLDARLERREDRWVPCYLWHESGLPTRADLRDFPYEYSSDTSESLEEPVTSSDAPAPIVDDSSQVRQHQV